MAFKTYVLIPDGATKAPAYQRLNQHERVLLDKKPVDHAYLKQTFTTPEGKNRTARLKLNCNTIWQDEQIKPEIGIGANEQFTQAERDAVKFVYEILMTENKTVQTYLESVPQFEGWWDEKNKKEGQADIKPMYRLLDRKADTKAFNEETRKRIKAANKVMDLESLEEGQNLMIRLNGSFFTPPDDLDEVIRQLVEFIDDADDAMLETLLREENSAEETVTILIGRAINKKLLSFEQIPNQVAIMRNNKWVGVREISNEHTEDERKRYFSEFLLSNDGKNLLEDLGKLVTGKGKGKLEV